jgi:hypothetical protein
MGTPKTIEAEKRASGSLDRVVRREAIPLDKWFPIANTLTHRCCKCGAVHVFKFKADLQMMVKDSPNDPDQRPGESPKTL